MRTRILVSVAFMAALAPAAGFSQSGTPQRQISAAPPNLNVRKPTALACKGMLGAIGDTVPLKATLTSKGNGQPVSGRKLSFKVAGKDAGSATTGPTGEAKLSYKVPNDPPPGPHPMEVRFAGDSEWGASSVSANFGVFKSSTKIVFDAPPQNVNQGETAQVRGKLTRITDQSGIDGREIEMSVNGKSAGKVVTANGTFTLSYPVPKPFPPKATVQAQFEGDVLYAATAATTAFPVSPPLKKAILTWNSAGGSVGETVTLKGLLVENTPPLLKGIPGQKVRFWFIRSGSELAHLCEGQTNGSGNVSCTAKVPLTPGSYPLMAYADVDKNLWDVDRPGSKYFALGPAHTHLALSGPASAPIGHTVTIKATLTRTTDNAPIGGAPIHLAGQTAKQADASGVATFSLVIPGGATGPRSFKADFAGNLNYVKTEGSVTINVTPSVN
jgi:hypothetical protein